MTVWSRVLIRGKHVLSHPCRLDRAGTSEAVICPAVLRTKSQVGPKQPLCPLLQAHRGLKVGPEAAVGQRGVLAGALPHTPAGVAGNSF